MERKQNKKIKRITPTKTAFIGSIIILVGGFFLSYNYIQSKKTIAYDFMSNVIYDGKEIININEAEDNNRPIERKDLPEQISNEYIGYLTIPKINLTKGFLDVRAEDNDVEKNILVVQGSDYPDTERGNLILAGHSGTGWKAFFNDLYKLNTEDIVYVTYKDKKYTYKIVNIYKQQKVGKIAIYRNYDKTTLTLITCTNNDSKTQTIYISELINIE